MKYLKIYNRNTRQLEYYSQKATSEFWDDHWDIIEFKDKTILKKDRFLKYLLGKYTKNNHANVKVLEAGCGNGQFVYFMKCQGYDAYGVDFAQKTIRKINNFFPDLKVKVGNVNRLEFQDNFFNLYLSFGVVEHNINGYNDILKEAIRVVKPHGYIIFSFPYMSPLRKLKALTGLYKNYCNDNELRFYQYALEYNNFVKKCRELDLKLIKKFKISGLKGFKDEILPGRFILQKIYDYKGDKKIIIGIRAALTSGFNFFAGHTILTVLENGKKL